MPSPVGNPLRKPDRMSSSSLRPMSGGPYARYFQTAMRVIRRTLITPRPNLRLTRRRYLEDNSAVIVKGVVKPADATV